MANNGDGVLVQTEEEDFEVTQLNDKFETSFREDYNTLYWTVLPVMTTEELGLAKAHSRKRETCNVHLSALVDAFDAATMLPEGTGYEIRVADCRQRSWHGHARLKDTCDLTAKISRFQIAVVNVRAITSVFLAISWIRSRDLDRAHSMLCEAIGLLKIFRVQDADLSKPKLFAGSYSVVPLSLKETKRARRILCVCFLWEKTLATLGPCPATLSIHDDFHSLVEGPCLKSEIAVHSAFSHFISLNKILDDQFLDYMRNEPNISPDTPSEEWVVGKNRELNDHETEVAEWQKKHDGQSTSSLVVSRQYLRAELWKIARRRGLLLNGHIQDVTAVLYWEFILRDVLKGLHNWFDGFRKLDAMFGCMDSVCLQRLHSVLIDILEAFSPRAQDLGNKEVMAHFSRLIFLVSGLVTKFKAIEIETDTLVETLKATRDRHQFLIDAFRNVSLNA